MALLIILIVAGLMFLVWTFAVIIALVMAATMAVLGVLWLVGRACAIVSRLG